MFYNKESYIQQANELVDKVPGLRIEDFQKLYELAEGNNNEVLTLMNSIIEKLFKHPYSDKILVDWSFFDTPVGELISEIRFHKKEKTFYAADVAKLADFSVQYINREAHDGNIIGEKRGKMWEFKETEVNKYLIKKSKNPIK